MTRSPDYVRRHQETSTTGKWDTGNYTGNQIRAAVADYLNQGPEPQPAPEVDMFIGQSSDGRYWCCNGVRKTYINLPATLNALKALGIPTVGLQPGEFWNEFATDEQIITDMQSRIGNVYDAVT